MNEKTSVVGGERETREEVQKKKKNRKDSMHGHHSYHSKNRRFRSPCVMDLADKIRLGGITLTSNTYTASLIHCFLSGRTNYHLLCNSLRTGWTGFLCNIYRVSLHQQEPGCSSTCFGGNNYLKTWLLSVHPLITSLHTLTV